MQFVVFWNIEWLKHRLQKNPLSGRETYIYLFCWLILLTLAVLFETFRLDSTTKQALTVSDLLMPILGVAYCWFSNGGKSGKEFVSRLISMGWVISLRIMVFSFPVLLLLAFASVEQSQTISKCTSHLLMLILFWRLGLHLGQLNRHLG